MQKQGHHENQDNEIFQIRYVQNILCFEKKKMVRSLLVMGVQVVHCFQTNADIIRLDEFNCENNSRIQKDGLLSIAHKTSYFFTHLHSGMVCHWNIRLSMILSY